MPAQQARSVIEEELGGVPLEEVFEWIDLDTPLGSASIAQVCAAVVTSLTISFTTAFQTYCAARLLHVELCQFLAVLTRCTKPSCDSRSGEGRGGRWVSRQSFGGCRQRLRGKLSAVGELPLCRTKCPRLAVTRLVSVCVYVGCCIFPSSSMPLRTLLLDAYICAHRKLTTP